MNQTDFESLDASIAKQLGSFDYELYREIYKRSAGRTDVNNMSFYPLYQKVRNKVTDDMIGRTSLIFDKLIEYNF